MKNLSRLCFALVLLFSFNANAQDENNPWALTIGANAVDLYPVGDDFPAGDFLDEYFNATDHWNILPSLSTLSVSKYLGEGFTFGVRGAINQIDKIGDTSADDLSYYSVDGLLSYGLAKTFNTVRFDPYIGVGGGYAWLDDEGFGTANGTLGFNYWFNDNVGIKFQSTYKYAFEDENPKHFMHVVGLALKFGGKDTDGDGIYDKDDACPEVPGLEAFNGCPDSDGDGIEDSKDDCPNEAGLAEFNGCPDADGDGVPDKDDKCPTVAGLKELNGCPDKDGDGVADGDDECPDEAGPAENNGCPYEDKDGDGVLDKDDECPEVAGTVANNGCPEVTEEVQKQLNEYAKTILFDLNKSKIQEQSEPVLADIIAILNEYPNSKFTVEGHTDSSGSDTYNMTLSNERAIAVKDYLTANGVDEFRLSAKGYGEERPIDSNKTRAGRANNRRVEINLVK